MVMIPCGRVYAPGVVRDSGERGRPRRFPVECGQRVHIPARQTAGHGKAAACGSSAEERALQIGSRWMVGLASERCCRPEVSSHRFNRNIRSRRRKNSNDSSAGGGAPPSSPHELEGGNAGEHNGVCSPQFDGCAQGMLISCLDCNEVKGAQDKNAASLVRQKAS